METVGKITGIQMEYGTNTPVVSIALFGGSAVNEAAELKGEKVSIKIQKWRPKRSLDANALLWKYIGEIASALRANKWDVYLLMLRRYGQFTYICVKPEAVQMVKRQWRESEEIGEIEINGEKAVQMLCYYGSSTYDTRQFSVLLDGVVSEMKEMGLETLPSEDMRRILELHSKKEM